MIHCQPTFVDTWGWMALGNRRDARHAEIAELFRSLRSAGCPIYTSDYVVDELATLLFRREAFPRAVAFVETLMSAAAAGQLAIERVTAERFAAAWELRVRLEDKPMISFTDLTSMVLMRDRGIQQVLTEDAHFSYVGFDFQILPQ